MPLHTLPDETVVPVRLGRIIAVLGIAIALLATINEWYKGKIQWNTGVRLLGEKWNLIEQAPPDTEWLILGDSTAGQGVDPEIMSEIIGGGFVNLATVGDMLTVNDAWLLQSWIERRGRPRGVVVVHAFSVYPRGLQALVTYLPYTPPEWTRLKPAISLSFRDRLAVRLTRVLPLYFRNKLLSQVLFHPWKIMGLLTETDSADVQNTRGFVRKPGKGSPPSVARYGRRWMQDLPKIISAVSEENQRAMRVIADVADREEIPVFWAHSPVDADLATTTEYRAFMSRIDGEIGRIAKGSAFLVPVNDFDRTVVAEQLHDSYHVNDEGARCYSGALARAIHRELLHQTDTKPERREYHVE